MLRLLALLFVLAGVVRADDAEPILANGDFSDGLAHWHGPLRDPDEQLDGSRGAGAMVKLQPDGWSIVVHDFNLPAAGDYKLVVTLELTAGAQTSTYIPDYLHIRDRVGFNTKSDPDGQAGAWVLAITDLQALENPYWTPPSPKAGAGPRTYTFALKGLDATHPQTLKLGFPIGSGTFHLISARIVPASVATPTSPLDAAVTQ
jgi:hypothetical protein